jgi:metallophosphoesterase (TIGR00282 family)
VGDVVGRPGRQLLAEYLPKLTKQYELDCVIVNGENMAGGSGLTPPLYEKLKRYGTHLITLGDHAYRRRDVLELLQSARDLVRPANFPAESVGRDVAIYETTSGVQIAVMAVLGRMFMKPATDCPYKAVDRVINTLPRDVSVVFVDVHAEATSEKIAMGWHLDGRVTCAFGTHTHVQTADERVLPNGTAYITDIGMTGPHDSVLGRRKDHVLKSLTTGMNYSFDVAIGDPRLHGIVVTADETSGRALGIERIAIEGGIVENLENNDRGAREG